MQARHSGQGCRSCPLLHPGRACALIKCPPGAVAEWVRSAASTVMQRPLSHAAACFKHSQDLQPRHHCSCSCTTLAKVASLYTQANRSVPTKISCSCFWASPHSCLQTQRVLVDMQGAWLLKPWWRLYERARSAFAVLDKTSLLGCMNDLWVASQKPESTAAMPQHHASSVHGLLSSHI